MPKFHPILIVIEIISLVSAFYVMNTLLAQAKLGFLADLMVICALLAIALGIPLAYLSFFEKRN